MSLNGAQKELLGVAKKAAIDLGEGGRELTSLIGEPAACKKADLSWKPSDGYDATSQGLRFQIKTRKSWSTDLVNPSGRMGRFGTKKGYKFDVAVYVELDDGFNVVNIWQMSVDEVKNLEEAEGTGRGLHVKAFVDKAKRLSVP